MLIDCTNPVGPGLSHGLSGERSGSAFVQSLVPDARVVNAFSIYGFENFENSAYPGYHVKPVMMLRSDGAAAKTAAAGLIAELGWEPAGLPGLSEVEASLRERQRTSLTEVSSGVRI